MLRPNFRRQAPVATYFRGKVLRNTALGTYALWIFGGADLVVAVASAPAGPFVLRSVTPSGKALRHKTGDFSFLIDEDPTTRAQTAFIVYNANMKGIAVEQLAPDFLSSLGPVDPVRYSVGPFGGAQTEAPVLFTRNGVYYALFDHTCCVCAQGSGVQVWTASSPLGTFTYQSQVARTTDGTPVTHAQQCWVAKLPGVVPEYIWIGDRWGSAPDGLHGHDSTYWQPLEFDADGGIRPFRWVDDVTVNITDVGS